MKFIIGIGNPEKHYEKTRHNVGFRALDGLCEKNSGVWREKKKLRSQVCSLEGVVLIKPETYVNNTGEAAALFQQKHDPDTADFLFVCDDVNLGFGKIRLRDSGSSGGHHGLESVARSLGTDDFARLRIGVGNEAMPKDDLAPYVLGHFSREEEKELGFILDKVSSICAAWIEEGFEAAIKRLSEVQSIT